MYNITEWSDLKDLLERIPSPASLIDYTKITIHTPYEDRDIFSIEEIDMVAEYSAAIGIYINVRLVLEAKDWVRNFYHSVDNMEVTLGNKRYKAIVNHKTLLDVESKGLDTMSDLELEKVGMIKVDMQLLERAIEALRYKTVGGIYKNIDLVDLISSITYSSSRDVHVDGEPAISTVIMDPLSNERKYANIVIPSGLRLLDLPGYMHNRYGLYSTGLGYYVDGYKLYIYPAYKTNITNKGKKDIKILLNSSPIIDNIDSSWYSDSATIIIAGSGETKALNRKDAKMIERGNGIYFPETFSMMKKPVEVTPTGVTALRNRINNEFVHMDRADGGNYTPRPTSENILMEMSRRAEDMINTVVVNVNNFSLELLEPGSPTFVYRKTNTNTIEEIRGIVLSAHTYILKNRYPVTSLHIAV